jgi:hypothetical protein
VPVNTLAHGDVHRLQELAGDWSHAHPASWSAMLAYLAAKVLSSAPNDAELLRVQREALVPLELRLLDGATAAPTMPGQLTTLVLGALEAHQTRRGC